MGAALHTGMRSGSLCQLKRAIDQRLDALGRDEWQHMFLDGARDRAFIGNRTSAQRRASVMETLEHDSTEINCRFRRTLKSNLHDAPFDGGSLVVALDVIASHHVENNIGAPAASRSLGDGHKVFRLIVNGRIGTELAAG